MTTNKNLRGVFYQFCEDIETSKKRSFPNLQKNCAALGAKRIDVPQPKEDICIKYVLAQDAISLKVKVKRDEMQLIEILIDDNVRPAQCGATYGKNHICGTLQKPVKHLKSA